jgi:hypothetical protein
MGELPDGVLSCMIDVLTEKESSSLTEADGFLTVKRKLKRNDILVQHDGL